MPSPIAHSGIVMIVRAVVARHGALRRAIRTHPAFFYAAAVGTLLIPDVDFLLRAVFAQPVLRHGGATHSLLVGVLFGLLFAMLCRARYGATFPAAVGALIGIGCAWSHAVIDMATWGRGVLLLWPFSFERYSTVTLFFGARHSLLFAWKLHLITLSTELLFVTALWGLTRGFWRRTDGTSGGPQIDAPEGAAYGE